VEAIDPVDLLHAAQTGRAPVILDVRSRAEYEAGHVPGALHAPFWSLLVSQPPPEVAEAIGPVVLYCGHGPRARLAAAALRVRGIGPLVELSGHMSAWRRACLPEVHGAARGGGR
jgi:rhodanese-related sulfurtransferase